jgi:hypothetical protein
VGSGLGSFSPILLKICAQSTALPFLINSSNTLLPKVATTLKPASTILLKILKASSILPAFKYASIKVV